MMNVLLLSRPFLAGGRTLGRWIHKFYMSAYRLGPSGQKQRQEQENRQQEEGGKQVEGREQEDGREHGEGGEQEEGGEQQGKQREMQLTRHDPQRTMDPWIAVQVANANHSPIYRLPEELLLDILDCIGDDPLTLYCLRHVSRKFRRLVEEPKIEKHFLVLSLSFSWLTREEADIARERHIKAIYPYYEDVWRPLKERLQRDGLCARCIQRYDSLGEKASRHDLAEGKVPAKHLATILTTRERCKFDGPNHGPRLYCHGCRSDHDQNQFSVSEQGADKQERMCLARQGAVQLCQHVHIPWATIEAHISSWQKDARRHGEMDWQACLDSFRVECHDPSHDTRCTAEEATSWPEARLRRWYTPGRVILSLSWSPHGGHGALTLDADNRYRASELRTLFAKHRLGPASILLPSYASNPLPEMACFDPSKCRCIDYETGSTEDKGDGQTTDVSGRPSCVRPSWKAVCASGHGFHRFPEHNIVQSVFLGRHWPIGVLTDKSECLVTTYNQMVTLDLQTDRGSINPPHAWLHAMDPDTYDRPVACQDLPLCKDERCMNYYRRPRSDWSCRSWLKYLYNENSINL